MVDTRAETASVIQYQRKRKRQQKVKDLETEPMNVVKTTNSFIKENESLHQELDSTRGQKDVKLLMNDIKSLPSSQSELRQERTPSWIERTGASSVLDIIGLNSLPDDVLIAILSRMTLVEAVRTSVLSRRWRHLWEFTSGRLDFDFSKTKTELLMDTNEAITWVNRVLKLHQGSLLDSFIVRLNRGGVHDNSIVRWIYFAMQKEVKRLELQLGGNSWLGCHHDFPKLKTLLSLKCAFGSLRSLNFQSVNITDEVVHYFLASCPNLEQLWVCSSRSTRNLEIVDPIPNLKSLAISRCPLESLKISATSILSFSFGGLEYDDNKLLFGNIPNLRALSLNWHNAMSFIYDYKNNKHASYSVQLVKLSLYLFATKYARAVPHNLPLLYSLKLLKLATVCAVGQSLHFFTLLIKAAPVLHEFRIEVSYKCNHREQSILIPFPIVSEAEAPTFHHENLKLVEMVGYVGCLSEEEFLLHLFKVAPSLEKVVIEVKSKHFDEKSKLYYHSNLQTKARTMEEAKERAKHLQLVFPPKTKLVVR